MKRLRTIKVMAAASALMIFFAAVSVAYAGLSWTGIDPAFKLSDGTPVNVYVAVPPGQWCDLDSPIHMTITAPVNADTTAVESSLNRTCGGTTDVLTTLTRLIPGKHDDKIKVVTDVSSNKRRAKFPVEVMISVGGTELQTCSARVNHTVKCSAELDNSGGGGESHGDNHKRHEKGRESHSR